MKALKPEENQELKSIEGLFPKEMRTNKIKNEIDEIKKWDNKIKQKDLNYKTNKSMIFNNLKWWELLWISIDETEMNQSNLLENIVQFHHKTRPKKRKIRKKNLLIV